MDCLTPDPQAAIHRSTKRPACNYCKKRKIKCDGLANCFQCQKRGLKCEYTTSTTTNECGVVARLTKRVCRLASELEEQKKLADYWRAQFEELKCQKCNQSELVCAQRPELCVEPQEVCSDVSDAVSSVLNAFLEVTRALLPASTIEHSLTHSTMIWNKLVDKKSNEVVARIRSMNLDTIIEALYYSSVFALGSRLHQDDDLAVHFHQIADGLLSSTSNIAENYCKINAEAARQIALSHVYSLFYYKASGMFTSINWSWQQTAEFISKISANLAQDTNDEISAWIMLFAPTSKRDLCQMEATNGTTESFLLKNIALAFRLLSQLHLGTESIAQQAWNLVIEAESHLVNIQASSNYTFYCVLIYALKALAAVNMPHEMNEEINRCTQIVAHLYTQVPSSSEQVWLSRDIEYLHHILTELQQEMSDIYGYDLMLDVVENIQFMFLTSPTADMCTSGSELSSPSAESLESIESIESMDSLPYNYSANQFMHPLVIYSPFATSC